MNEKEIKNTEKAVKAGFVFYLFALGASAMYSFLLESRSNTSFTILMAGLNFFFGYDFILNKIDKKERKH
ncbi:hypothetical protein [Jeotgalibacillus proteolyticus]|nr:hypothetical protein [Jeotgalibacillus proteolyticus]